MYNFGNPADFIFKYLTLEKEKQLIFLITVVTFLPHQRLGNFINNCFALSLNIYGHLVSFAPYNKLL